MSESLKNMSESFILPKGIRERYLLPGTGKDDPFTKYGIHIAGLSEVHPPYRIIKKNPRYHHIVYSLSGKAEYKTAYEMETFKPGCFWAAPPKLHHSYWAEEKWHSMWFILDDNEYWWFLHKWPGGQKHSIWKSRLLEAMEGYLVESMRTGKDAQKAACHLGHLIFIYLSRDILGEEDQGTKSFHYTLEKLWQEVNSKLQYRWTVDELAKTINVSKSHFHRLVLTYYQLSPIGMLTEMRMKRAKELLLHTDYPIKLISELTGYNNPYSFSKAFKRQTGISPGGIRQRK